ncbi:MAG TPA: permease [Solirubrobacteraceae bacterium]|jgi:hypothetical protein
MVIWHGLRDALLMAYEVWWALVLGFFVSAVVQAWVPRERIERSLAASGPRPVALATALGAASSSCSYAAVAIAKSLFAKGASAASALAFQFASTNLVWELAFVLWALIGWQFALAEYFGGLLMIALMAMLLRAFVSPALERAARERAQRSSDGHRHPTAVSAQPWRARLVSADAWSDVAHNFRGDWQMLWREIAIGMLLAGFVAQVPNSAFAHLFLTSSPATVQALWGALLGPAIAVASFVCSVGNVPLAAVLWSGGISFAGVVAFLFADLIVLPIVAIYRKFYGAAYAVRITALMFVTMAAAALVIDAAFAGAGLIPTARPSRVAVFGSVRLDYKLILDVIALTLFGGLIALTARKGVRDPVCGMRVDRARSVTAVYAGREVHFCSERCRDAYASARAD